jgi:hypothetical protein
MPDLTMRHMAAMLTGMGFVVERNVRHDLKFTKKVGSQIVVAQLVDRSVASTDWRLGLDNDQTYDKLNRCLLLVNLEDVKEKSTKEVYRALQAWCDFLLTEEAVERSNSFEQYGLWDLVKPSKEAPEYPLARVNLLVKEVGTRPQHCLSSDGRARYVASIVLEQIIEVVMAEQAEDRHLYFSPEVYLRRLRDVLRLRLSPQGARPERYSTTYFKGQ